MSVFDQLLRRAVVAAACVALDTESARAQPGFTYPAPAAQPAGGAAHSVTPASGVGRGRAVPLGGYYGPGSGYCPPAAPCAPGGYGTPGAVPGTAPNALPGTAVPPGPTPQPGANPPAAENPAPPPPDFSGFGRDVAGVPRTVGVVAPNLHGDFFGARSTRVAVQSTMPGFLNGKTIVVGVNNLSASGNGPINLSGDFRNGSLSIRDANGVQPVTLPVTPTANGIPITNPLPFGPLRINGAFTETVPGVNQAYTSMGAGGTGANFFIGYFTGTVPAGGPLTPPGIPPGFGTNVLVPQIEQAANPGARVTNFRVGDVQGFYDGTELRYFAPLTSTVSGPPMILNLPNPGSGGGGVVGFVKISEDNNPLPRDRVIFNYDYFGNVPFTPTGLPVNRYQFGLEKTFLDGRGSLEVRLPFASTLNSDGVVNATGTNTELGNLRLALKGLLLRRETVNVSAGLGVYLPTADDVTIRNPDGSRLVSVKNSSVQLSPFAAVLYTPTERLFGQAWMGFTFDTGGNRVQVDPNLFGRTDVGNLRGATLWTVDAQVGYWLYQADAGFVRGAAPFVELHYNGQAGNGSVLNAGRGLFIGDTIGSSDELNMTAGVITRLGDQSTLSVAASAPLRTGQNRSFDYQVGVRLNYYFGYTARNMTRGTAVSSFGQ